MSLHSKIRVNLNADYLQAYSAGFQSINMNVITGGTGYFDTIIGGTGIFTNLILTGTSGNFVLTYGY